MEHACWCKMILPEYIRGCGVGLSSVMYVMTYIAGCGDARRRGDVSRKQGDPRLYVDILDCQLTPGLSSYRRAEFRVKCSDLIRYS